MSGRLLLAGVAALALGFAATGVKAQQATFPVASGGGGGCAPCSTAQTVSAAGALSAPAYTWSGAPITGGSGTTTFPLLYANTTGASPVTTFNTGGTYWGVNAPSGFAGLFIDLHVSGGGSVFNVNQLGSISAAGNITGLNLTAGTGNTIGFAGRGTLFSTATGNIQLGGANAASPVAQTLSTQGSRGGADTNIAGANLAAGSGAGTGNAAGSTFALQTPHAGSTGTAQQTMTTQILLGDNTTALPQIATDATHTDATICEDTTTHQLFAGSGTAGVCLGTSSLRYKHGVKYETPGLAEILALKPIQYHTDSAHGDPRPLHYGLAAEDVARTIPDVASLDTQGRPNSVDYVALVPVLIKAVQQEQAQIAALERRVHRLEHRSK